MTHRFDRPGALLMIAGAGAALMLLALVGRGRGARRRAANDGDIDIEASLLIDATPERVFEIWSNCENYPRFLSHVKEARPLGDGRSHWIAEGPAGLRLEWMSELTDRVPSRLLCWRSTADAAIEQIACVRLEPAGEGTRVSVRFVYRVPQGALSHAVATLLGRDPQQEIDDDLKRMKQFAESGVAPTEAARQAEAQRRQGEAAAGE
ncbi:SRPBCC family protein [Aquincola sp. S2]|uniref:SRPBCC family protein n=1 Tax=Pseudaquabacterium terrae TaxID=2732868 RepID=A0ABX2EAN1_9BURK|nr:SRPBCC family protein [Aquabacterium terrae]NRF65611.1 SRPBCC family protein [Aquabacterium terrae]